MDKATQLHIVARAIHSLEYLRDNGHIRQDGSSATFFAEHTWEELQLLKAALLDESGVLPRNIDLGASMVFIEAA